MYLTVFTCSSFPAPLGFLLFVLLISWASVLSPLAVDLQLLDEIICFWSIFTDFSLWTSLYVSLLSIDFNSDNWKKRYCYASIFCLSMDHLGTDLQTCNNTNKQNPGKTSTICNSVFHQMAIPLPVFLSEHLTFWWQTWELTPVSVDSLVRYLVIC